MNDVMTDSACRQDYGIPFSGKGQGGPFVSFCLPAETGGRQEELFSIFHKNNVTFPGKYGIL